MWSLLEVSWEVQSKRTSFTGQAFNIHMASMCLGDMFDYGKTKPCATNLSASCLVHTIKPFKEALEMFLVYAATLVTDTNNDFTFSLNCLYLDNSPLITIFDGIIKEVYDSLFKERGIDFCGQFFIARELNADFFWSCFDLTQLDSAPEHIPDRALMKDDLSLF